MYIITNEGLKVLEEKGLKKILDSSFPDLEHHMLIALPYEDEIEEYAVEKKLPHLIEKVEEDGILDKRESFIMHSEIICDLLKKKLPKTINKDLKDCISAYYIYHDRFIKKIVSRDSYLWRDENSLNIIEGDIHGDMLIKQFDLSPDPNPDFFGYKPLFKKVDLRLVNGFYPEWIRTLSDFITFCIQTEKQVPFKESWGKEFYNGFFEETKAGEVADYYIDRLKWAKEGKEHSFVQLLPFVDNPKKQMNIEKGLCHIEPISADGGYLSFPFIENESLFYLHQVEEGEKGVEFLDAVWGSPSVKFNYNHMEDAIKGVVTCIQKGSSRCQPQDPGLVFKYFPYERFKDLKR